MTSICLRRVVALLKGPDNRLSRWMSFKQQSDVCAIIVAAGSGSRAGSKPKQFQMLVGKQVLRWSVEALSSHSRVGGIVVVIAPGTNREALAACNPFPITFVDGGKTRSESVRAGLGAAARWKPKFVLIHDAARPGVRGSDIDLLLNALEEADGAAPALPVVDSIKRTDLEGGVIADIDRSGLQRAQTPQAFRSAAIEAAYKAFPADRAATDDLSIALAAGYTLKLVPGGRHLDKITFADDFDRMEQVLSNASFRVGSGFDVHAFGPGDHVCLCGVKIPYGAGLIGHSDADAAWHALTDALLGALAEGDIGDHFPPTDEKWRGMDSTHFLKFAADRVSARGGSIINVDLTIICEAPKVKPHRDAMRARTAEVLGLPVDAVSVKATTTERLGFLGRQEGLAAQAAVTIKL